MQPFSKVLIANRGEIACRIIAACRELGLKAVAVYSPVDAEALHVRLADEAQEITDYLDVDELIRAARTSGADAVHPGYGFRAESTELAEACARYGIAFVGPNSASLKTMADKRSARELARAAGVDIVPGYEGDVSGAVEGARKLGYPVLVKAALGGGGKGMRRVDHETELQDALESAARVAGSAFGDSSVYLERCLERPRHIEVQILGDGRGGVTHLFERECSLQRRHQKVIEESPSAGLDPELSARIAAAAVALAQKATYLSAGTCEFLLAEDGAFYFLEMNTRIQVEHPVTEMTTGVDLVKAQLRLAMGAELPPQDEITIRGHAIEARLLAEDVDAGFLPQAGQLLRFDVPRYPFLRLDTGFDGGSTVPVEYDSMLAKVIAWGSDRAEAWARLRMALDGIVVHGVRTNLPLLRWLAREPKVMAGEIDTTLLESELLDRYLAEAAQPLPPLLLAAAALSETLLPSSASGAGAGASDEGGDADRNNPFQRLGRFRLGESG